MGQMGGGFGGGMDMHAMQQQMMQNPEMMHQMMNSPMMQNLLNNPELMTNLLNSNPQIQAMLDANPHMRQVLNDPAVRLFRDCYEYFTAYSLYRLMSR